MDNKNIDNNIENTTEVNEVQTNENKQTKSFKEIINIIWTSIKKFFIWLPNKCPILKSIVNSKSILKLIVKCIVMYIIPFAWVWIAAFIWDAGLNQITSKTIDMIFAVFCTLLGVAVLLSIWAIIRFSLKGKRK